MHDRLQVLMTLTFLLSLSVTHFQVLFRSREFVGPATFHLVYVSTVL